MRATFTLFFCVFLLFSQLALADTNVDKTTVSMRDKIAAQEVVVRDMKIMAGLLCDSDITLNFKDVESGQGCARANIKNLSNRYTLKSVALKVALLDCPAADTGSNREPCDIIQEINTTLDSSIPPLQAREATSFAFKFDNLPKPRGHLILAPSIEWVEAM